MKPLLIGLSGQAGSGKSTVGDYLTGAYGYEQFAFAGRLKAVAALAFGFSEEQMERGKEVKDRAGGCRPGGVCSGWGPKSSGPAGRTSGSGICARRSWIF